MVTQTARSRSVVDPIVFNPSQANSEIIITRFHIYVFNIEEYKKRNYKSGSTVSPKRGSSASKDSLVSSLVTPKIFDNLRGTMPAPKS